MIAWLRMVLGLCQHKWLIHREVVVYASDNSSEKRPIAHEFYLKCEHCGNMKKRRF